MDGVVSKNSRMQSECGIESKVDKEERKMNDSGKEQEKSWAKKSIQCGTRHRKDGSLVMVPKWNKETCIRLARHISGDQIY